MLIPTNLECINSSLGKYCTALNEVDEGCMDGTCKFFKTDADFKKAEAKACRRCERLGLEFRSRAKVIEEMDHVAGVTKKRNLKKQVQRKIIQYRSEDQVYIEHESIEECAAKLDMPKEKLLLLIKKGESWKGYKFVLV